MISESVIKFIDAAKYIAVDTETDGLNVRKNHIIGIGIYTDKGDSVYVQNAADMKRLAILLKDKKLIAWNAYFDLEMIRNNLGIDLWDSLYCDVILLKHTVDEEMPFKLKEVAKNIFGEDATIEKKEVEDSIKANGGSRGHIWLADPHIIEKYCLKDCELTVRLFKHYSHLLVVERLESFFYQDEVMPLYKTVTRYLQSHGIAVNIELATKLQTELTADLTQLHVQIMTQLKPHLAAYERWYVKKYLKPARSGIFAQKCIELAHIKTKRLPSGKYSIAPKELEKITGKSYYLDYLASRAELSLEQIEIVQTKLLEDAGITFNISSKLDLKKVFFDQLGLKPLTKTKLGSPQINDEFLKSVEAEHEFVKLLRDYNKLIKIKGSYIDRILERSEDGIYYPQFFQHRTVSGRFGSDLQQLPRPKSIGSPVVLKYNNELRALFLARSGHVLIGADYESLEPKCFAHVSGEQKIKDIFNKGHDFYSTVAIDTEQLVLVSANKSVDNYLGTVEKDKRNQAKVYSLGIPYGMESFKLAKTLGCSQNQAEVLIRRYFDAYPALYSWFRKCDEDFKRVGVSSSQAGRKRHLKKQQAALFRLGDHHLNALELWKAYNGDPVYDEKKDARRFIKNGMNNFKNFQIQSLAASITNRACIAFNKKIEEFGIFAKVVLQVHDEIVVEVEAADQDLVKEVLQRCMEETYKIDVPLIAKPVIGKCYGELK